MSPNISSALNEIYISDGIHKGHTETIRMENNEGSVIYTLDSNLIAGSNYKAYFSTAYGSAISVSGSSNNPFTIKASTTPVVTPSITVLTPNGGETFIQGEKNIVSWTGGKNKVQIGVVKASYTGKVLDSSDGSSLLGWIDDLNGKPNSSLVWDGITLHGLLNQGNRNILPGQYKIIAVSSTEIGNYCFGSSAQGKDICNFDLSDNTFTIKNVTSNTPSINKSTIDVTTPMINVDGCTSNSIFSSTTGYACPKILTDANDCLSGHKFSATTGQACSDVVKIISQSSSDSISPISITRTLKRGVIGDDVKIYKNY